MPDMREYVQRFPDFGRWQDEASKAAAYLQDHPASKPNDIADYLGVSHKTMLWVLRSLIDSNTIVKTNTPRRGVRYYLRGQKILEDDHDHKEIDAVIIKTANKLLKNRNGWGVRANDIRIAMEDDGVDNIPNNYKIVAVLRANGYVPDPKGSVRKLSYIKGTTRRRK